METFKNITDYETYSVSNIGRVMNNKTGRILKPCLCREGYLIVDLRKTGEKKKHCRVHRLVATEFIENPDDKLCVDHIDGDRSNNNVSNLRWATHSENLTNSKISNKNTSGVKGVSFDTTRQKWRADIRIDGKNIKIGRYSTLEDAKIARYDKAVRTFGEFMHESEELTDEEKMAWSLMRYELYM